MIDILELCNYEVKIKSHGVDTYGRCLAEVISITPHGETKNVNRILLDEGLAVDYNGGKKS
jgi:endonuclease YncB( thermonuclease family)